MFKFFFLHPPLSMCVLIKESTNLFIFHQRDEKFNQRISARLIQTKSIGNLGCDFFHPTTIFYHVSVDTLLFFLCYYFRFDYVRPGMTFPL